MIAKLAHGVMLAWLLFDAGLTVYWTATGNVLVLAAVALLVFQVWTLRGFIRWHIERWVGLAMGDVLQ